MVFKEQILPQETSLMIGIRGDNLPQYVIRRDEIEIDNEFKFLDGFVEVILYEPLYITYRGSKMPIINNVECMVPSLNFDCKSLNHAYTIISEEVEINRVSHIGNVFERCFFMDKEGKWHPLKVLRETMLARHEKNLFLDNKIYALKEETVDISKLDKNEIYIVGYLVEFKRINGEKIKLLYKDKKDNMFIKIINSLLDKGIIYEIIE